MDIIFHAHHAVISERMRQRVHRGIDKLARRHSRLITAIVRFEGDGPMRRVEVTLQAPRRPALVAEGRSRNFGPALGEALLRLQRQLDHRRRTPKARARRATVRA